MMESLMDAALRLTRKQISSHSDTTQHMMHIPSYACTYNSEVKSHGLPRVDEIPKVYLALCDFHDQCKFAGDSLPSIFVNIIEEAEALLFC